MTSTIEPVGPRRPLLGGEATAGGDPAGAGQAPRLLLADETIGVLDLPTAPVVLGLLQRLHREQRLTIVLITHNSAIAEIAEYVVRIVSGRRCSRTETTRGRSEKCSSTAVIASVTRRTRTHG